MLPFLSSVSFQLFLSGCFCPGAAYLQVISGFCGHCRHYSCRFLFVFRSRLSFCCVFYLFFHFSTDKPFFPYCISGLLKRVAPVPLLFLVPLVPPMPIIVSVHCRMRWEACPRDPGSGIEPQRECGVPQRMPRPRLRYSWDARFPPVVGQAMPDNQGRLPGRARPTFAEPWHQVSGT